MKPNWPEIGANDSPEKVRSVVMRMRNDLSKSLNGCVSFSDNMLASIVELNLEHGRELSFPHPTRFKARAFWPFEAKDEDGNLLQLIGDPVFNTRPRDSAGNVIPGKYGLTARFAPTTIGERVSSFVAAGSGVTLVNNTAKTVTSISLSAGLWDVGALLGIDGAIATTYSVGGISLAPNALGTDGDACGGAIAGPVGNSFTIAVPQYRVTATTTIPVYLVAQAGFGAGTLKAYGRISAVRADVDPATAATVTGVLVGG